MKSRPRVAPMVAPAGGQERASRVLDEGLLEGDFEGFEDVGTVFVFARSRRQWRQAERKCCPHYAYMPSAQVVRHGSRCHLEVRGMRERVLVVEVTG